MSWHRRVGGIEVPTRLEIHSQLRMMTELGPRSGGESVTKPYRLQQSLGCTSKLRARWTLTSEGSFSAVSGEIMLTDVGSGQDLGDLQADRPDSVLRSVVAREELRGGQRSGQLFAPLGQQTPRR
jgi:hypothetical protein